MFNVHKPIVLLTALSNSITMKAVPCHVTLSHRRSFMTVLLVELQSGDKIRIESPLIREKTLDYTDPETHERKSIDLGAINDITPVNESRGRSLFDSEED